MKLVSLILNKAGGVFLTSHSSLFTIPKEYLFHKTLTINTLKITKMEFVLILGIIPKIRIYL